VPSEIAVKVDMPKIKPQETKVNKKTSPGETEAAGNGKLETGKKFNKILDEKISSKKVAVEKDQKEKKTDKKELSVSVDILSAAVHENIEKFSAEKSVVGGDESVKSSETDSDEKKISAAAGNSGKKTAEKNIQNFPGLNGSETFLPKKKTDNRVDGKKRNSVSEKGIEKTGKEEKEAEEKLTVLDLRSEKSSKRGNSDNNPSFDNREKSEISTEQNDQKNDSTLNQSKEIAFIKIDQGSSAKSEVPVKSLTAEQSAVLEKLKSDGNSEIVKQTKIILNDNSSGELKMVLKPERLGYVRIKINLDDNNIVGRIIVDNNNIKEIFENNMESLLRSFRESGFGNASLEVSVGGGKKQKQNMDNNERFFSKKIIEDVDDQNIIGRGINTDSIIDLVV
jgi:flagellar hook-length control protein FliK